MYRNLVGVFFLIDFFFKFWKFKKIIEIFAKFCQILHRQKWLKQRTHFPQENIEKKSFSEGYFGKLCNLIFEVYKRRSFW
jgi:hypothetical protein